MNEVAALPEFWHEPWPADGLESVPHCPVCGDVRRELLYADLVDNVFRVAPGKWQLWRCTGCRSAYLDPRPTQGSIHIAYSSYFTHTAPLPSPQAAYETLSAFRKLRRRLHNGYTNRRYSTRAQPASAFGILAAYAVLAKKRGVDSRYRHLPPLPRDGGKLLDVGCGSGAFLRLAQSCGWEVAGVDPDPKAAASGQGFPVYQGGLEYFGGQSELFDVITLSHVIEHVHNPIDTLRHCNTLLKTGGQLWLQTPNIDSFGYAYFGRNWVGLDPPRHLVLFNLASLYGALWQAGFHEVRLCTVPNPIEWIVNAGNAIQAQSANGQGIRSSLRQRLFLAKARIVQALFPSRREFLTVAAHKSGARPGRTAT